MENLTLNRVELRGRVGHDPRVISVNGQRIARFSIATNEIYKDRSGDLKEETTWHKISAWEGKGIEDFDKIHKGVLVNVLGKLRVSKFQGQDGNDRLYTEIVAGKLSLAEVKEE